jgi:hypothetical protein
MDNLEPEDELASPLEKLMAVAIVLCACTVFWVVLFITAKEFV